MSKVFYSMSVSHDGYVASPNRSLDFAYIDDERHDRRMYQLLVAFWATGDQDQPYFPPLDRRLDLKLIQTRMFSSRVVYMRYERMR